MNFDEYTLVQGPKVSVLMSVHNNASTLKQALQSVVDQSYQNWELILCDDCSSDDSWTIMKQFAQQDTRIVPFQNQTNLGLAASLNECLKRARGTYCARMDGDDISCPDRFARQVSFLEANPQFDLAGSWMQVFDDQGLHEIITTPEHPRAEDVPRCTPFSHATIMMKTSCYRSLNGYCVSKRTRRTEDLDLWYRFFAQGFHGANICEPLYQVRVDEKALKRRKLTFALDAAALTWNGCQLLNLSFGSRIYALKPIVAWALPEAWKKKVRKH